ncbi:MAG: methyltransferase domain-containing protein [Armatimonadota bacterium]|nr:methyltransferase domain-containing protein [Armatimonadota bacterium]
MTTETLLTCPICRETLTREQNALRCGRGHSYDIAKGGYVNLLLVNQKGSPSPGDSKEMLISRRAFLEKGYYEPLSARINDIVTAHLDGSCEEAPPPQFWGAGIGPRTDASPALVPQTWGGGASTSAPSTKKTTAVLDAGCGEGYYLECLRQHLAQHNNDYYGLDISKEAVKLAAQKYKAISFSVASLHQALPFPAASLDVLLSVFAPRNAPEFARVLSPGGIAIAVIPAEGHLAQLQEALGLGRLKADKEQQIVESLQALFSVTQTETLRYRKTLDHANILNLLTMIPTGWQLSEAAWRRANALSSLEIEFAFTLVALRKKAAPNEPA